MRIYLDTSAFVKNYHTEKGSDQIESRFEDAKNGKCTLVMSIWVISETINALDKHRMRKELSQKELNKIVGTILHDISDLMDKNVLEIVDIETESLKISWEFIINDHLSCSDSLHLVTALQKNCDIFLAADQYLVKVAKKKISAYDVETEKIEFNTNEK